MSDLASDLREIWELECRHPLSSFCIECIPGVWKVVTGYVNSVTIMWINTTDHDVRIGHE